MEGNKGRIHSIAVAGKRRGIREFSAPKVAVDTKMESHLSTNLREVQLTFVNEETQKKQKKRGN